MVENDGLVRDVVDIGVLIQILATETMQGAVDILLLVKCQMEQATGLEVLSMGVWCQGELQ